MSMGAAIGASSCTRHNVIEGLVAMFFRKSGPWVVIAMLALLTGCASPPPRLQVAVQPLPATQAVAVVPLGSSIATHYQQQFLNPEQSILYYQTHGGGGVGLGLMLGPLGVAANMAMIEKTTLSDVEQLYGRVRVQPAEVLAAAVREAGFRLGSEADPVAPRLKPYLRVSKTDIDKIQLTAALLVELPTGAGKRVDHYFFQLPGSHSLLSLRQLGESDLAALQAEMRAGYKALLQFMARDSEDLARQETPITFQSAYLYPRFEFELPGALIADDGTMVWLRGTAGVYAVRKADVTYVRRQGGG